jgi:hypothetical protein
VDPAALDCFSAARRVDQCASASVTGRPIDWERTFYNGHDSRGPYDYAQL